MPIDFTQKALTAKKESKFVDFKESFDGSPRAWLKMLKSIVAMANTDGGVLVFGVCDNGELSGWDVEPVLAIDPAVITDKLYSYTDIQFEAFEIVDGIREGSKVALLIVDFVQTPMVFNKQGKYKNLEGKIIPVFQAGTLFFRHGAKSEPANTNDVRKAIEKRVETIRKDWFKEVKRVVAAPPGTHFVIKRQESKGLSDNPATYRASTDPSLPETRFVRSEEKDAQLFLREELSDDLFQEVNNVLGANNLLAMKNDRFMMIPAMYYWVYAKRYNLSSELRTTEFLAKHGLMRIYGPSMYLFLKLPIQKRVELLKLFAENPKSPDVNALIRITILLGPEATSWLFDIWKRKMPGIGQHPDFYWSLERVVSGDDVADRKLTALRTLSNPNQIIEDDSNSYEIKELMASAPLADALLTDTCMKIYEGRHDINALRHDCRRLDVLAYGDEIIRQSGKVVKKLIYS